MRSDLPTNARAWALVGDKAGDNAQVLAVAESLGIRFEVKSLTYNKLRTLPNWVLRGTLKTLSSDARASLEGPWPDVVVAAGRRSVPIARYLVDLAQDEGRKRPLLIHLGRPRAPLHWFDLVLTTPQYGLPQAPNIVHLDLPVTTSKCSAQEAPSPSAPPFLAVLVGGDVFPYRFDEPTLDRLIADIQERRRSLGAQLGVTCGRRMPQSACEYLRTRLTGDGVLVHSSTCKLSKNPYRDWLRYASAFMVTTDSVSMMSDAIATGRPVSLFSPLAPSPLSWRLLCASSAFTRAITPKGFRNWLVAQGFLTPMRRTELIAHRLIRERRATWSSDSTAPALPTANSALAPTPSLTHLVNQHFTSTQQDHS